MACDFRTFSVLQGSFLIPVLFIISLFNGIYSQTTFPGNPTLVGDFEKNEGETVTLSCSSVGGNPLPSVQWYKNQQLVDPGSSANGDGIYTVGSSTVTYNNYTFTVSRSDNLVSYICKVQNSLMANPTERAWAISVYVPSEQPFISGPEPAITTALNSGSTYKYVCTAQNGRPAPILVWKLGTTLANAVEFHQGITENTTTNADITLSKSSSVSWVPIVDDNGKNLYCQTVQTTAGGGTIQKSTSVPIVVQLPSEQPFISGAEPAITTALNSGSTYKYVCTVQNGRPAPILVWKLGTTLANAVEFHQGITENTTTNADSTLSKSSSVSWVPIVDDNGKNLYCQTVQTTAGGGTIQKSTSVPIVVQPTSTKQNPCSVDVCAFY